MIKKIIDATIEKAKVVIDDTLKVVFDNSVVQEFSNLPLPMKVVIFLGIVLVIPKVLELVSKTIGDTNIGDTNIGDTSNG